MEGLKHQGNQLGLYSVYKREYCRFGGLSYHLRKSSVQDGLKEKTSSRETSLNTFEIIQIRGHRHLSERSTEQTGRKALYGFGLDGNR